MKQITKYQASDGTEFYAKKECSDYEALIERINFIMARLKPLPEDKNCDFSNGGGFVQQSELSFKSVKFDLLCEIKKHINHKWVEHTMNDEGVHLSYVGRLISDKDIRPITSAWYRLMCTDKQYREWGQPYFAEHPEEGHILAGVMK